MKNNHPIGIFDSGLGGLTVFEEVRKLLPYEKLVYVADSAFAPYGDKDDAIVMQRCESLAHYLMQTHKIKALVVACNTATAAAIQILRERLAIPVIGMEPAIKPAVAATQSGVVGVLATANTIKSDKFSKLLDSHQHRARIITQPCVGWVEAIERGDWASEQSKGLVQDAVQPLLDAGADTLVLGCTHYPWLAHVIQAVAGDGVRLIGAGAAVAKQVQNTLKQGDLYRLEAHQPTHHFYTSGDVAHVEALASKLLQRAVVMRSLPSEVGLSSLSA